MDLDLPESKNTVVPFIDKRLYFKKNEKLGLGIYVSEFIKTGTIVEIAPVLFCENEIQNYKSLSNYTLLWKHKKLSIGMGWSMYYNHSDNNNCIWGFGHENLLAIATTRDVQKNEQLTVNYGNNWFESRNIEKIKI